MTRLSAFCTLRGADVGKDGVLLRAALFEKCRPLKYEAPNAGEVGAAVLVAALLQGSRPPMLESLAGRSKVLSQCSRVLQKTGHVVFLFWLLPIPTSGAMSVLRGLVGAIISERVSPR